MGRSLVLDRGFGQGIWAGLERRNILILFCGCDRCGTGQYRDNLLCMDCIGLKLCCGKDSVCGNDVESKNNRYRDHLLCKDCINLKKRNERSVLALKRVKRL